MSEPIPPPTSSGETQALIYAIAIVTLVGLAAARVVFLHLGPILAAYTERLRGPVTLPLP